MKSTQDGKNLARLTDKEFDKLLETGTRLKMLGTAKIYIGENDYNKKQYASISEVMRKAPKESDFYLEGFELQHWERHEQWDSSGESLYAKVTYYKYL